MEKEKLEIFRHLQQKKQQLEAYEKEKQRAALSLRDQDSDMADIDRETFPGNRDVSFSFLGFVVVVFGNYTHVQI